MNNLTTCIRAELTEAKHVLDNFLADDSHLATIEQIALIMTASLQAGGKILACGNGGSHCDAMHFAEEMTGRFRDNRKALAAIAISDPSHLSCVSNDFGFDFVFSRYVEGLGQKNDALLAISTSGNSKNILEAVKTAKSKGLKTIALTGKTGGELHKIADISLLVPHQGYADRIQEIHIKVIHILILLIENLLFHN